MAAAGSGPSPDAAAKAVEQWSQVLAGMKALPRAVVSATKLMGVRDGAVVLAAPNDTHRSKCAQYLGDIDAAMVKAIGASAQVVIVVDGAAADDDAAPPAAAPARASSSPGGSPPATDAFDEIEAVDLDELVDVPPESVQTSDDRLLDAFPGSQFVEEP